MLFAASAMAALLPVEDLTFDWQGRHFRCTVSIEEVMASPSWIVNQPAPPLAARKASQLAKSYATNLVAHAAFGLKKISLVHVTEDKWIYEIIFFPGLPDTYSGPFAPVTFVVFMDGTVAKYREIDKRPNNSAAANRRYACQLDDFMKYDCQDCIGE